MMFNKYINWCDAFTLLWCYYVWHSTTVESATSLSQLVLFLGLLWSVYHMFYDISHYKLPVYFKGLNVIVLMYAIYGLIRIMGGRYGLPTGGSIDGFYSFKKVCISLLPIYSFFHYAQTGLLDESRLRRYSLLFVVTVFMAYKAYYTKRYGVEIEDDFEYTNNTGYLFLALIPIITFWRSRPVIFYSFLGFVTITIVMCMKRGAIVSGVVALTITMFYAMKDMPRKRQVLLFLLTVALLVVLFLYVIWLANNSAYFMHRYDVTMEGDANGRDRMYPMFLEYILNRENLFFFIFGDGFDGSLKNLGIFCHNDWFEITIDHGILGLCFFVHYWWCFFKNSKPLKIEIKYYLPILLIITITFLNTLYSFSITNMTIFITCVLGYCLSKTITIKQYHNG